jgi:hypothetical protein
MVRRLIFYSDKDLKAGMSPQFDSTLRHVWRQKADARYVAVEPEANFEFSAGSANSDVDGANVLAGGGFMAAEVRHGFDVHRLGCRLD